MTREEEERRERVLFLLGPQPRQNHKPWGFPWAPNPQINREEDAQMMHLRRMRDSGSLLRGLDAERDWNPKFWQLTTVPTAVHLVSEGRAAAPQDVVENAGCPFFRCLY